MLSVHNVGYVVTKSHDRRRGPFRKFLMVPTPGWGSREIGFNDPHPGPLFNIICTLKGSTTISVGCTSWWEIFRSGLDPSPSPPPTVIYTLPHAVVIPLQQSKNCCPLHDCSSLHTFESFCEPFSSVHVMVPSCSNRELSTLHFLFYYRRFSDILNTLSITVSDLLLHPHVVLWILSSDTHPFRSKH